MKRSAISELDKEVAQVLQLLVAQDDTRCFGVEAALVADGDLRMAVLDPESNFAASNVLGVVANADTPILIAQFFLLKKIPGSGAGCSQGGYGNLRRTRWLPIRQRTAPFGRTPATAWRLMRATFTFRGYLVEL